MDSSHCDALHSTSAQQLATLQAQMQRASKATNAEGSFELGWGSAFLLFASVPYLNAILPKQVFASTWLSWAAYIPLICAAFAPYAVPRLIKRFITWPRTGYVSNPHEPKLPQLVLLMIFGGALGFALSLPFVLAFEWNGHAGNRDTHQIILHVIKLIICLGIVVWLWPKVIRKRAALPTAYDAGVIDSGLKQTASGRRVRRAVRFSLVLLFIGVPLLVCGVTLGIVYLSHQAVPRAMSWTELGVLSFLTGTNAILYLMINAVALKQHRWKWIAVVLMVLLPILIAPASPYPHNNTDLPEILKQFPPVTLSISLVWLLSGALTLALFIRHNPVPEAEAQ
jgi:cytochrome bd-type quinol oxidase subunit 2